MSDEVFKWINYAEENLQASRIMLKSNLFNSCLQNVQQAVEKSLKALLIHITGKSRKSHSINELTSLIKENGISVDISDDECDFLDSIYLPSKYPLESVIPDYRPDTEICQRSVEIAERTVLSVKNRLENY